ncbi:MAG: hypothetical protein LBP25_04890 [Tannerellaceae bacterium]|jgi:hypothetical protein|nr:hypothetical protein [Tannerellaceae bacterium]
MRRKSRVEVEDFSDKTTIFVKQAFYAKVPLMSLFAGYAHPVDEKVRKETDGNRKHGQQINRTGVLSMTRDIPAGVFLK